MSSKIHVQNGSWTCTIRTIYYIRHEILRRLLMRRNKFDLLPLKCKRRFMWHTNKQQTNVFRGNVVWATIKWHALSVDYMRITFCASKPGRLVMHRCLSLKKLVCFYYVVTLSFDFTHKYYIRYSMYNALSHAFECFYVTLTTTE